jgi:hypothetical protein
MIDLAPFKARWWVQFQNQRLKAAAAAEVTAVWIFQRVT